MISLEINKFLKVSCVTVTKGRFDLLKKSVQCYINQTYPNKELVILSQAEDNSEIKNWLMTLNRTDIVFAEAPPDICLGEMRNTSMELAHGDIICQWDDDDLYHSDRVSYQYQTMMASADFSGSCYTNFLKYFKEDQTMYWCDWWSEGGFRKFLCGSIMFHKKYYHIYDGHFYPENGEQCHVEEDFNVLQKLVIHGPIAPASKGYHYVYVYHGYNTYEIDHHRLTLDVSGNKIVMNQKELLRWREKLIQTMHDMRVEDTIHFKSIDHDAFTYTP
jgi:glycosyltransferase involved in cell wall biosynthesis